MALKTENLDSTRETIIVDLVQSLIKKNIIGYLVISIVTCIDWYDYHAFKKEEQFEIDLEYTSKYKLEYFRRY